MPWLYLLAKVLGLVCLVFGALLFLAVWSLRQCFDREPEDDNAGGS